MNREITAIGKVLVFIVAIMLSISVVTFADGGTTNQSDVTWIKFKSTNKVVIKNGEKTFLSFSYASMSGKDYNRYRNEIKWTSSNNKVATVKNGTVTGKTKGKTIITVSIGNKSAKCTITVNYVKPKYISTTGCYSILNKYRKNNKVIQLKRNSTLENYAKIRAREIAVTGKFSHTRPNGKSGLSLIKGNLYKGENIAMGQTSCNQVMNAWYKSKAHKRNMVKKQYRKVGIACYRYNCVNYWVQLFSS